MIKAGEQILAADVLAIQSLAQQNSRNILNLFLQLYFEGISPDYYGLFFDGFSDTDKVDAQEVSIDGLTEYTTPGSYSWTCPAGVTSVVVQVIGGGGGGGCRTSNASGYKGNAGAGGGAYSKKTVTVTPGNSYTVVVGAGGQKGTASQSPTSGGDSYFDSATNVMAKGGHHSANNSAYPDNVNTTALYGGQASAGYGDVKYSGGAGGLWNSADFGRGSGGGGAGGATGDGAQGATAGTSSPGSGGAGNSPGGNGGTGGNASGSHAPAVSGYGGGGGGGCWYNAVANGADGGGGYVSISYSIATSGADEFTLADSFAVQAGDEVEIYDGTQYELNQVDTVTPGSGVNTITLKTGLAATYGSGAAMAKSTASVNTVDALLEMQSTGIGANKVNRYYSERLAFQQGIESARVYITRKITVHLTPSTAPSGSTVRVTGDYTGKLAVGDTVEVYEDTLVEGVERRTVSAIDYNSTHTGETTVTLSSALTGTYTTASHIDRVDVLPKLSIAATGADESFVSLTHSQTTVNSSTEASDVYEITGTDGQEVVVCVILTRNDTSLTPYARNLGVIMQDIA